MYAKQSVQTPKLHFKLPRPPRTRSDQREYFRILGQAVDAAAKPRNRPALIAVAEALIQRTGPRTGQIYFGTKGRDVELILKGLVLLGVNGAEMALVVRIPAELADSPDYIVRATEFAKSLGAYTKVERLEWKTREMKGGLLRLDVKDTFRVVKENALHWEGRVRGLNHAAAWIRMVESLDCS